MQKKLTAPIFGIISAITYQRHDRTRASIYVEGEFSFGINAATIEHFRIRKGDEIDSILYEKLRSFDEAITARRIAQKYLNTRRRTEREVRRKLEQAEVSPEHIESTISQLKQTKLIDDLAYAQAFIHDRLLGKSLSRIKIAMELQAKGVDRALAEVALRELTTDDSEFERALIAAKKKLPSIDRKISDKRMLPQKLYAFLASRGFTSSTIRMALKQLGQEAEEIDV